MAGDATKLVYEHVEVIGDPAFGTTNTRLRFEHVEVIADPAFGTANTRLRYAHVEVIADAPPNNAAYKPIVMACN